MRRFEFRDQKSSKFWAIERSGSEVITRWGRIDSKGQSASKDFGDPAKAASEVDKQIRSKTSKGYVEVAVAGGDAAKPSAATKEGARNRELELAIAAAPDDPQAWSVYADWLQGQGDPWGERLSLGIAHASAKAAEKAKLKKAIDKLEEAQR